MASRLKLQRFLKTKLDNVYYQPPESIKLNYPCVIYRQVSPNVKRADDSAYLITKKYELTLVHKDPDNDLVDFFIGLPYCRMATTFCKDNLYHYVFELFY